MSTLQELAGITQTAGTCQVTINRVACREAAESTWEGGCVHEHVTVDIAICAGHRELAARPFDCLSCKDHKCMVQLREVSL